MNHSCSARQKLKEMMYSTVPQVTNIVSGPSQAHAWSSNHVDKIGWADDVICCFKCWVTYKNILLR